MYILHTVKYAKLPHTANEFLHLYSPICQPGRVPYITCAQVPQKFSFEPGKFELLTRHPSIDGESAIKSSGMNYKVE